MAVGYLGDEACEGIGSCIMRAHMHTPQIPNEAHLPTLHCVTSLSKGLVYCLPVLSEVLSCVSTLNRELPLIAGYYFTRYMFYFNIDLRDLLSVIDLPV